MTNIYVLDGDQLARDLIATSPCPQCSGRVLVLARGDECHQVTTGHTVDCPANSHRQEGHV